MRNPFQPFSNSLYVTLGSHAMDEERFTCGSCGATVTNTHSAPCGKCDCRFCIEKCGNYCFGCDSSLCYECTDKIKKHVSRAPNAGMICGDCVSRGIKEELQ